MALNFDGEEEIAPGVNAYRFATPEGRRYYERDPAKAMQLGMPPDYLNRSAGAAPVRPDARLANLSVPITNPEYGGAPAPAAEYGPPVASPEASDVDQASMDGIDLSRLTSGAPQRVGSAITNLDKPMAVTRSGAGPGSGSGSVAVPPRSGAPRREAGAAQQQAPVDPNADFENQLNRAAPLPDRYVRTRARAAGYRPESMKVSGADPEAVSKLSTAYDDLDEQRAQIAQLQLDAAEEQAGNDRINARVARMDAEEQAKKQESLVKAKEDAKRRQMAMLDAEEQQAAKRSPDSQRVFKQKGSGSYFLAALMRGLGELGASMSKSGRNGAAEIIDRRIDQDIAEQEAEIASDKDAIAKRKNAYASYLADGHDPEFAREKLKWMQSLQAEAVAREAAAETNSQQAKAYFLKQADDRALANLEFKKGLLDKQNVQIDSKYDRGSTGGLVENPNFDEQVQKRLRTRNAVRAENMGTTQDAYEAGKKTEATNAASGGGEKLDTALKGYSAKLQDAKILEGEANVESINQLIAEMEANGVEEIPTPDTRNVLSRTVRGALDTVGGAGTGSMTLDDPGELRMSNTLSQIMNAERNRLFGATQSEGETRSFANATAGTHTLEGLKTYKNRLEEELKSKKKSVGAGFDQRAVQQYEQRNQAGRTELLDVQR